MMSLKKILSFSVGPLLSAIVGLVTLPIISWYFPVEHVGRIDLFRTSISLLVALLSLGMHQAYVREYHEVSDKGVLLRMTLIPPLFFTGIIIAVGLPFSSQISSFLFELNSPILGLLFCICLVSMLIIHFCTHILRMEERGWAYSLSQLSPKVLFILLIGCVVLSSTDSSFTVLAGMYVISILVSAICFGWLTKNSLLLARSAESNRELAGNMMRYSFPLVVGGLLYWALSMSDRFLLRILSNLEQLGVYSMAVSFAGSVTIISSIFANIWHPLIYKQAVHKFDSKLVQSVFESMLLTVVLIWSAVALLSWIIPMLLPADYDAVGYLVVACIAGPLLFLLSETTVVGIGLSRRTYFGMLASLLAAATSIGLNIILIPYYGAAGASISSAMAFFVFFFSRTEISAWLGYPVKRIKAYLVLIMYLSSAVWSVINGTDLIVVWVFLMVFSLGIFYKRVLTINIYLKSMICGRANRNF